MAEATGKDAIFFQIILTSMKNKPDVDWAVVASKAGYKDAKTASTRYGQIMKKLTGVTASQAMAGNGTMSKVAGTPKKPKAPVIKKEVGSGTNVNASKVVKRAPAKKSKKIEILEDEEEDEEFMVEEELEEKRKKWGEFVDAEEEMEA